MRISNLNRGDCGFSRDHSRAEDKDITEGKGKDLMGAAGLEVGRSLWHHVH